MNRFLKNYILFAAMAAYVFLAVASLVGGEIEINRKKQQGRLPESYPRVSSVAEQSFRIGISRGKIAVFDAADGRIIRRTETQAALLPEGDRKRLERGISVTGSANLRKMLEDICS